MEKFIDYISISWSYMFLHIDDFFKILNFILCFFLIFTYTSRESNQELTLSLEKRSNFVLLENEKNLILYFCFLSFGLWNLADLVSTILNK